MKNNLKHVLVSRAGDKERLIEFIAKYIQMLPYELIDAYNDAWKIGIVGSHAQGLSYYALHRTFEYYFGKSPFILEDNIILSFSNPIKIKGITWEYVDII